MQGVCGAVTPKYSSLVNVTVSWHCHLRGDVAIAIIGGCELVDDHGAEVGRVHGRWAEIVGADPS